MSGVATTAPEMNAGRPVSLRASLPAGSGTALSVAAAWIALIAASGFYRSDFLSHQTVLVTDGTHCSRCCRPGPPWDCPGADLHPGW